MMSFVQMNKSEIVKKQYLYKLKAFKGSYSSLIIIQIAGLLFSIFAINGSGGSGSNFSFDFIVYSADIVVGFTLFWSFITGLTIASKNNRNDDFTFISNRQTSNLSNALFLLTISIIGGTTAILMGVAHRVLVPLFATTEIMAGPYTFSELAIGIAAAVLYCVFLSISGYLIGTIVQYNKAFKYIVPLVLIGLMIGFPEILGDIFRFYYSEASFLFFLLKAIATAGVCFILAVSISSRMEVRK